MSFLNKLDLSKVKLIAFDFDGVFTDNSVIVSEHGHESVICSRYDGLGLTKLREVGVEAVIISTEVNSVVSARAKKLKIPCFQSVLDKEYAVKMVAEKAGLSLAEVAFLGNDINDIPALKVVGYPLGVRDSWPDIVEHCAALTMRCGGKGAVREVCDEIVRQRGSFHEQ